MVVLSLFDGMACGRIAFNEAGIEVSEYYAAEIDKHAIKVTRAKFPNHIHLGSVTEVHAKDLPPVDIIIGGSPCQGFSFAGKGLNFNDPRSALFFEFVRLLEECREKNPKVLFLLENVRMKKQHEDVISRILNIQPIIINSALVSAQNRERLYWTNIAMAQRGLFGDNYCTIPQPKDRGIFIRDILQEDVDEKYFLSDEAIERMLRKEYSQAKIMPDKSGALNTKNNSGQLFIDSGTTLVLIGKDGKIKQNQEDIQIAFVNNKGEFTPTGDKSTCLDANYFKGMDNHAQRTMVKVHNMMPHSSKSGKGGTGHLTRSDGKSYCLDTGNTNAIEYGCIIRRLTPIEVCRLQTVPDDYFFDENGKQIVSDTQIYKMIGNGWTIDVIAHILSFIKK